MSTPRFVYSPMFALAFGEHVFPVEKYSGVHERLLSEGLCTEADFLEPELATAKAIGRVHTAEYLERMRTYAATEPLLGLAEFEAPCFPEVIEAFERMTGGTLLAARQALATRTFGFNIGGGFHHAMPHKGEGFCLLNDIAITLAVLLHEGAINRAVVIDVDAHQGNGTAVCFAADPRVLTFSIHNDFIYPAKAKSDLDVGLPMYADDREYLDALRPALPRALDDSDGKPDLVVYAAGADPYREDQLGNLGVSIDGLAERDRLVLEAVHERAIPVAVVLAGGYARRTADIVTIHTNTAKACLELWPKS